MPPTAGRFARASDRLRRGWRELLIAATGLSAVFALLLHGYERWAAAKYLFDDSFISFRYAANLVAGHGLIYNAGERVEGYSNFLWTLLVALGMRAGWDPVTFTRALGVGSYLLCFPMLLWIFFRSAAKRFDWGFLCASLLVACLALDRRYPLSVGSGLETSFASLLLLLLGLGVSLSSERRATAATAIASILLVLTRMDGALAWAGAAVARALPTEGRGFSVRTALRRTSFAFVPVAIALLAYLSWKQGYYGALLPNTYYAKRAYDYLPHVGADYLSIYFRAVPHAAYLLPLALVGALHPVNKARRFAVFAGITLTLRTLYLLKVGGDFMEFRFIWEVYPLYVALAGIGVMRLAESARPLALVASSGAVLLCTIPYGKVVSPFSMQAMGDMDRFVEEGTKVGKALKANLPPDTVVATTLAGTIAYYSELTIIDQWGLNDAYIARLPGGTDARGHMKYSPKEYLRKRGANLYLDHPVICDCKKLCKESKPNVFIRIGGEKCVRAWYFVKTPALTRHLCSDRKNFILHRIDCSASQPP